MMTTYSKIKHCSGVFNSFFYTYQVCLTLLKKNGTGTYDIVRTWYLYVQETTSILVTRVNDGQYYKGNSRRFRNETCHGVIPCLMS